MNVEIRMSGRVVSSDRIELAVPMAPVPAADNQRFDEPDRSTPILQMGSSVIAPGLAVSVDL